MPIESLDDCWQDENDAVQQATDGSIEKARGRSETMAEQNENIEFHTGMNEEISTTVSETTPWAKKFGEMGHEYFERHQWREAMEMYNKALCFVENDSVYMGFLYAVRGLCFGNLQMYDAGIVENGFA